MDQVKSLTGTCAICYAEKPKYRCPRCKSQTCSLTCYKKHQQRASCSGERNPATFIKKSQWATAAGIDHDYNYLKSVELNIERAETSVQPIREEEPDMLRRDRAQWRSDSPLQRYFARQKITIIRAPEGMSRSRANKTRITRKGKMFWTVEFIDADGAHLLDDECWESDKLGECYAAAANRKRRAMKREQVSEQSSSKRRRVGEQDRAGPPSTVDRSAQGPVVSNEHDTSPTSTAASSTAAETHLSDESTHDQSTIAAADDGDQGLEQRSMSATSQGRQPTYFYLTITTTGQHRTVVSPLDDQQTIATLLQGRTLQEFPTIHVLTASPKELPPAFMLDDDYRATAPKQEYSAHNRRPLRRSEPAPVSDRPIDTAKMLDMLRRDLS